MIEEINARDADPGKSSLTRGADSMPPSRLPRPRLTWAEVTKGAGPDLPNDSARAPILGRHSDGEESGR